VDNCRIVLALSAIASDPFAIVAPTPGAIASASKSLSRAAASDGGGSAGVCAAGGGHDDTATGNYSLAKVASFSGPVFPYSSPINIGGPQDGNIAGPISLNLNQNGAYTFAGQMNNSNHLPNTMAALKEPLTPAHESDVSELISLTLSAAIHSSASASFAKPSIV
jgi:hypothetical protein